MLQHLGRLPPLQHAVLSPSQETLEEILSDGEANDQLLPWEQWPVEEPSETLCGNWVSERSEGGHVLHACQDRELLVLSSGIFLTWRKSIVVAKLIRFL